ENITRDLLESTMTLTHAMLEVAGQKGFHRFDKLILVGGSSRMPMIENRLREEFSMKPFLFDPDEAVAKGAAIIGNNIRLRRLVEDKLQRQNPSRDLTLDPASPEQIAEAVETAAMETGYTLEIVQKAMKSYRNVTSKSFGSVAIIGRTDDGVPIEGVINLIYRNTQLPASNTKRFVTMLDNQPFVRTAIAENMADQKSGYIGSELMERPVPLDESKILWEGRLQMLPGLPAGSPTDDTYQIDENGLLTLISEDPAGGNRIVQKIETGMTEICDSSNPVTKRCRDLVVD
ncbi:MAG: Hsp70 family protein, partial [Planctomycetaceae bacterium]|nr:Hsp70 family protein [Planctomycetaceae bacterium]